MNLKPGRDTEEKDDEKFQLSIKTSCADQEDLRPWKHFISIWRTLENFTSDLVSSIGENKNKVYNHLLSMCKNNLNSWRYK